MKTALIIPRREIIKFEGLEFNRVIPEEKFEDGVSKRDLSYRIKETAKNDKILFSGRNFINGSKNSDKLSEFCGNDELIKMLEQEYANKQKPGAIVFDYQDQRTNVHAFLRDIYIKQNLHIFRTIPLFIADYNPMGNSQLIEGINVLAVNGSPRKNGDTNRLLHEEVEKYWTGPYYRSKFVNLESISECIACGGHQKNCKLDCVISDQMRNLIPEVKNTDVLIIGSPVYMDLPTSRTIAFLSRLTAQTKFNRRAYIGKYASVASSAWCSGTKAVVSSLNNALEMMGFTIQGRSSREYIGLWRDMKTRGGVPSDFYWPE